MERFEKLCKRFSVLCKFTDLIDQINESGELSALLEKNSKTQLERATEFLPN